jgi:hypothetical protein
MATCRKVTYGDRIAAAERLAGRALTEPEKVSIRAQPPAYECKGAGVAGLRGARKIAKKRRK